jgi:hypothetical protein
MRQYVLASRLSRNTVVGTARLAPGTSVFSTILTTVAA